MPETTPARPVARLTTELAISGIAQVALGCAVLAVTMTSGGISPLRGAVPFLVVLLVIGAASLYQTRWLRDPDIAPAQGEARVEERSGTIRRSAISLVPIAVVVLVAGALGPGLGLVLAGVVTAVGAVDLRNRQWVMEREAELGREIHRELGRSPFTMGRRPLYTLPRNASTLAM